MKFKISTFQKINIVAIISGIITFFIPALIDTSDQTRQYYLIEFINTSNLPIISLLIAGFVAAIISTIMSFKGMLDMCIQYIAGILIMIAPIIFIFYFSLTFLTGFFLGYAPFAALISGMLIIANASTEIKNYSREELILPKGIVLTSLWNLIVRNLMPFNLFLIFYLGYNNYFFLVFFIIRSVLDVILVFGARSVLNKLKIGGFICLISIVIMTIFEVWIFIFLPKGIFFALWLFLFGIPFLYQLNGAIKSFRESREL